MQFLKVELLTFFIDTAMVVAITTSKESGVRYVSHSPKYQKLALIFLMTLLVFSGQAFAETGENGSLKVSLIGYLVVTSVDDKGVSHETFEDLPEAVLPGGIIQYEIAATNTSVGNAASDVLKNVSLFGSVPEGTTYLEKTASSAALAMFSIDRGRSYHPWPVMSKVKLANGTEEERKADASQCTDIRWVVPELKPQETIRLLYRVKVSGR
jgi:uncharacterized repeat protein (TIGR01451 family)